MTEEFDLFTSERLLSTHSSLMDFIMTCKKKKNKEKNLHLLQCHKNCPLLKTWIYPKSRSSRIPSFLLTGSFHLY